MDDLRDIRDMYNSAWDAESGRLERHQLEADITWRYLDRYLPPSGHLLDVGCGTGAYAFALAERGYRITAVDLAEELVSRCKSIAGELPRANRIDFQVGDARNLDGIRRGEFDAVLMMGPLYHLVVDADRTATLTAAQIAAVEPAISADDESYNALDGKQRELWLEPSMLAASRHLLYVGRREDG